MRPLRQGSELSGCDCDCDCRSHGGFGLGHQTDLEVVLQRKMFETSLDAQSFPWKYSNIFRQEMTVLLSLPLSPFPTLRILPRTPESVAIFLHKHSPPVVGTNPAI